MDALSPTWSALGFNHFGEIVYDDVTGLTFISLEGGPEYSTSTTIAANFVNLFHAIPTTLSTNLGGIGVWDGLNYGAAVVIAGMTSLGWIALNPKTRELYGSTGGGRSIQRFRAPGRASDAVTRLTDLNLVNGAIDADNGAINGGKVSRHGKLWVNTMTTQGPPYLCIYGIDPYSGIIQVRAAVSVDNTANFGEVFPWAPAFTPLGGNNWGSYSLEAEGLDITDPPNRRVDGVIHAQFLAHYKDSPDAWALINLNVSDVDRL